MLRTPTMEIDPNTNHVFLRLPAPHDNIALTCPNLEDVKDIPPILNDDRVHPWMGAGLPYPHHHEHALRWLHSVKPPCDSAQEYLRKARNENITSFVVTECPVRILRHINTHQQALYVGDCGIVRWSFPDVSDEKQRQLLRQDNLSKIPGDPTIIWSIGYYLAPSYAGQGIMSAAIGTLLNWAILNMNVRHLRTTAMEGNAPSVKVLEKNGFTIEKTLPDFALKNKDKVGLHVLEWKAPL